MGRNGLVNKLVGELSFLGLIAILNALDNGIPMEKYVGLDHTHQVFDRMPQKNRLITCYEQNGPAGECLSAMREGLQIHTRL
ncbi:hypothetical protein O6P43_023384 [Quillaja saponaria]|uniref:Uncharacterized protein n=1 Tax=Quillaja saponaria TaxID=32244 RepID=A0AAD7LFW7_QUISA|nr:hypothetical protein O6P43_023384 [Quillaja saponaria]